MHAFNGSFMPLTHSRICPDLSIPNDHHRKFFLCRLERVLFFSAKPRNEAVFDALRAEAVAKRDVVVLPQVWEHYDNITHQTLEMCRAAALERHMTHLLKVSLPVPSCLYPLTRAPKFDLSSLYPRACY